MSSTRAPPGGAHVTRLLTAIPLPVTCPRCGSETMVDFPTLVVLVALTRWNQLALYATCHEGSWDASPAEVEKIRRHVGQAWIDQHRDLAQVPTSVPSGAAQAPRSRASSRLA